MTSCWPWTSLHWQPLQMTFNNSSMFHWKYEEFGNWSQWKHQKNFMNPTLLFQYKDNAGRFLLFQTIVGRATEANYYDIWNFAWLILCYLRCINNFLTADNKAKRGQAAPKVELSFLKCLCMSRACWMAIIGTNSRHFCPKRISKVILQFPISILCTSWPQAMHYRTPRGVTASSPSRRRGKIPTRQIQLSLEGFFRSHKGFDYWSAKVSKVDEAGKPIHLG